MCGGVGGVVRVLRMGGCVWQEGSKLLQGRDRQGEEMVRSGIHTCPVSVGGKSHGRRSLVGRSSWGR